MSLETRELTARGRVGAALWQARARSRNGSRRDDARWSLAVPAGSGRLLVGSQLRMAPAPDRRGWTGPLAARRAPPGPSSSLARTGTGVSWQAEGERPLLLAAGRDPDGNAVARVAAGARGWRAEAGLLAGRAAASLGWGGAPGGIPVRVELHGDRGGGLVRAALGGDAVGVLAARGTGGRRERAGVLGAGIRVRGGPLDGLWIEGTVRAEGTRARPFEAGWARRGAGWTLRAGVAGRASRRGATWRTAVERAVPGGGTVKVTLDGDAGPRPDSLRWSWRAGGPGTRAGAAWELPAGRPRAGSVFVGIPTGRGTRLEMRGRWVGGGRPAFDLEWTWPLTRRHSTR